MDGNARLLIVELFTHLISLLNNWDASQAQSRMIKWLKNFQLLHENQAQAYKSYSNEDFMEKKIKRWTTLFKEQMPHVQKIGSTHRFDEWRM